MITISDVISNTTAIEQQYGLFFIILNKFLNLLQDQNNIYKNKDFYVDTINNLINEDKLSIRNCSTFIIMSIYNENITQYHNTNNRQTKLIEKEIINNLVYILSQNAILVHVIEIINNILLVNFEEYYDKYKELDPNTRIKTIHSIKSQGRNVCQFVWDENIIGTPNITRVRNNILYQQDLSSCGFFLPSSSNKAGTIPIVNILFINSKNPSSNTCASVNKNTSPAVTDPLLNIRAIFII